MEQQAYFQKVQEIKELCEKNLSKFSIPYDYEYRKSLPKTLIGKVDYKQLEREAIAAGRRVKADAVEPVETVREQLVIK